MTTPDTNWEADFYLPELELWVEVDGHVGGTQPNKRGFASKVASFRERGESLVVVETAEELLIKVDDRLTGDRTSTSE